MVKILIVEGTESICQCDLWYNFSRTLENLILIFITLFTLLSLTHQTSKHGVKSTLVQLTSIACA